MRIEEFSNCLKRRRIGGMTLTFMEEDQLEFNRSQLLDVENRVAIHNEQFKQVEAWLIHDDVIAGMDKGTSARCYAKRGKKSFYASRSQTTIIK